MKKFLTTLFASFAILLIGNVASISAATPKPHFNYYNDVPNVGSEADFVRVSQVGANNYSNNVEACTNGQEVTVRVYIHNGSEPEFNGTNNDGPGVAKNTRLAIDVAKTTNPGTITGKITSSNAANGSISDTATVTCNGKLMDLAYVPESAVIKSAAQNYVGLSDNVFAADGTPIGYSGQDGQFPGCWEYVTYVFAKVKVTEREEPPVVPSDAICKIEDGAFAVIDQKKRTVRVSVGAQLTNATVTGYRINWGDGSTSDKQSDTHTYAKDGDYTIRGSVSVKLHDGTTKTVGGSGCVVQVKFEGEKPPVVVPPTTPPTELPRTGSAGIFGIFAATSLIGAVFHKLYAARKNA